MIFRVSNVGQTPKVVRSLNTNQVREGQFFETTACTDDAVSVQKEFEIFI